MDTFERLAGGLLLLFVTAVVATAFLAPVYSLVKRSYAFAAFRLLVRALLAALRFTFRRSSRHIQPLPQAGVIRRKRVAKPHDHLF